jgi:putative peptide zinc metalloprotease protein
VRRLAALLLAVAALTASALAQPGSAFAGDDNAAVAINTKDDASIFKLAFAIRQVAGDVVDNTNAAVAYSSCARCRTVAIAIQIVLVTGNPSTVTPQNVALAVNENCTLCTTFAGAYQIVLGTNGPVRLTGEGRREIQEILKQIRALKKQSLPPDELRARLDDLVGQLKDVLKTELVPKQAGEPDDSDLSTTDTSEEPATGTSLRGASTAGEQTTTAVTTTAPETTSTTTTPTTSTTSTTTTTADTTSTTTP